MRGTDKRSGELFSYIDLEHRVGQDHPLRPIREMANAALAALSSEFDGLYSKTGRPPIAPAVNPARGVGSAGPLVQRLVLGS